MKTVQIYVQDTPVPSFITSVVISGTAGQFSCTASISTLVVGDTIKISGTDLGTSNIVNYVDPKTYFIKSTNGTTTFTLSETLNGTSLSTSAGTTTGLTFVHQPTGQFNRLDLFKDEKISITSSIQNINDIAKTFSDFSQTFTVPASVNNNLIFKHWYENANDYGFSTLKKSFGYIEIDTIVFRKGKIELKSVKMSNGRPDSYTITFIGSLGTLKDKFSNLYLKDLDSKSTNFTYTGQGVFNLITGSPSSVDQKIMWPLISSDRFWNYNDGSDPTNNINSSTYPIRYNELFPALRVKNIFDLISEDSKWDINFSGSFLYDPRFEAAYLWMKNTEVFVNLSENIPAVYNSQVYNTGAQTYFLLDKETGIIETLEKQAGRNLTLKAILESLPDANPVPRVMTVRLYKNDVEYRSVTTNTGNGTVVVTLLNLSANEQNAKFDIRITTDQDVTFRTWFTAESILGFSNVSAYLRADNFFDNNGLQTFENSSILKTRQYFPEIKIEEFVAGIIKMFNLVCYSEDNVNYTIEQLEDFYTNGNFIDITEYIITDNNSFNSVPPYNKINFEYTKSESITNVEFVNKNSIEYGDFRAPLDFDGPEYSIKLPFENLGFNNLRNRLQVGYALKTDLQKYVTKPVILYSYSADTLTSLDSTTFYFSTSATGATSTVSITASYKAFGQEVIIEKGIDSNGFVNADEYSLNFPTQQSTIDRGLVDKGLYNQYYQDYLNNTFTPKARVFNTTCILPTNILTSIKLNDKIIIRDKKYIINTMTTDLTSGEVQFSLLTDFRIDKQKVYDVTIIGAQSWVTKALDVTTYRNGDPILQVTDPTEWTNLTTGAWCYYNNDELNGIRFGKLYNWYAVNDPRGLAPLGYHIPTKDEWTTLYTTVGGSSVAGRELKQRGNNNWPSPSAGFNNYLFTALPSGWRDQTGAFSDFPNYGNYYTATTQSTDTAWYAYLFYASVGGFQNYVDKRFGMAVRIIKD